MLKQGERDFRLDVSGIEKKALKNVAMEEKRLASLRKELSGTIQNEALQVKQEEMSKGLSEINTKQEELHSKIDDFKGEARELIGPHRAIVAGVNQCCTTGNSSVVYFASALIAQRSRLGRLGSLWSCTTELYFSQEGWSILSPIH